MIYLINQRMHDRQMTYFSDNEFIRLITRAIDDGDLVSALDDDTANLYSEHFGIDIPQMDKNYFNNSTPDDVPIMLEDNADFGDTILSLELNKGTNKDYYFTFMCEVFDDE